MTESTRLIDEPTSDELETSLLRIARSEGPSAASRQRILAGIAAAGAATASAELVHAAQVTKVAAKGLSAGVKWGLLGVVALALPTAVLLTRAGPAAPAAERAPLAALPAPLEAVPEAKRLLPVPAPTADTTAPVALEDLPALPMPAAASGAASGAKATTSLADEVAQLQKAKLALKSGNGRQALSELATYAQRFPRPLLGAEAGVVRIEALQATGDTLRAKSLAESFLARDPQSPYAARLRKLTGAR